MTASNSAILRPHMRRGDGEAPSRLRLKVSPEEAAEESLTRAPGADSSLTCRRLVSGSDSRRGRQLCGRLRAVQQGGEGI